MGDMGYGEWSYWLNSESSFVYEVNFAGSTLFLNGEKGHSQKKIKGGGEKKKRSSVECSMYTQKEVALCSRNS